MPHGPIPHPIPNQVPDVLLEGYQMEGELGRGSFGVVYLAKAQKAQKYLKAGKGAPHLSP